jgi:putative peptide zinc metalloprotease protein
MKRERSKTMRRFLLTLTFAALCSLVAASPPADAADNAAVAVNLRDGSSTFRLAFKVTRVNRDVVDSSNAAVAAASCTDCQTVAVAIQAVLIFSDPSVVTPTNFAFAFNLDCDRCYTLATAYQFVSTTGIVHFTAEGNQRIAAIRAQLEALRHSDLSIEEIQARVDALAGQLLDVMRTELVTPGFVDAIEPTVPEDAGAAVETTPVESTASATDAPSTAPVEAEPAAAEALIDSPTETTSADSTAQDSSTTATDSAQTTTDSTSEPTAEAPVESPTP